MAVGPAGGPHHRGRGAPHPAGGGERRPPLHAEEHRSWRWPAPAQRTLPGSAEPVAHDPGRPIIVVVDDRTEPPGARGVVTDALAEVAVITGLRFEVEDATDEVPVSERRAFQPDRYGDRWAPVLIAWSDPTELSVLKRERRWSRGQHPSQRRRTRHRRVRVGTRRPRRPATRRHAGPIRRPGPGPCRGPPRARAPRRVDHVDDSGQLTHREGHPDIVSPQPGDVAGLAALGRGACVPVVSPLVPQRASVVGVGLRAAAAAVRGRPAGRGAQHKEGGYGRSTRSDVVVAPARLGPPGRCQPPHRGRGRGGLRFRVLRALHDPAGSPVRARAR